MKKVKSKVNYSLSMNKKIFEVMNNRIKNKSKYIEYLVYQDLLKNCDDEELKNILL
jgi:hypothetical protein